MSRIILTMENICKEFPGVKALDNVNLSIEKGEIHALCGENGAGKSTLMKILGGVYPYKTYTGKISIDGEILKFSNVRDSENAGIAIVYQELALEPELEIAENIYLGNLRNKYGLIDWDRIYRESQELLESLGLSIPVDKKIKEIGIGQQQLIEISKALALEKNILVLDEPTAALTEKEIEILFKVLLKLKKLGVTCILITHKLNEIFSIANSVTVLRDGFTVGTHSISSMTEAKIINLMVGRDIKQLYPPKEYNPSSKVIFEVKGISGHL